MINIGSILWPSDAKSAINLYLGFLIKVIEVLGLSFSSSGPDPIETAKNFIDGLISEEDYRASANIWWEYLDSNNATRDLQNNDALMARVAICLLSVTKDDVEELGEHLSWFFEVLEQMGIDLDKPISMMEEYFKFKN